MGRLPSVYFCGHDNCSASFTRLHKFEIHERSHTGERPFVCDFDDCQKSYISSSHLKRHMKSHEDMGKNYKCSVEGCTVFLKTKTSLQKHLDSQHSQKVQKTYKCSLCDSQFNKHNWLQKHMFKHTGEPIHVCPEEGCGKGFLIPSRLKRHMKFHKGYPCTKPNCDQVLPRWSDLVKHIKNSHPVVHKCDVCQKLFSCSSNLKKHKIVHGSERQVFECEVPKCPRFYTLKKNLVHHIKNYHGRRPFMCPKEDCSRAFKTEDTLAEHLEYHNTKKPRSKKKKKFKPSLAAKLSGCAPKKTINRKKCQNEESPLIEKEQTENSSDEMVKDNGYDNGSVTLFEEELPVCTTTTKVDDKNTCSPVKDGKTETSTPEIDCDDIL